MAVKVSNLLNPALKTYELKKAGRFPLVGAFSVATSFGASLAYGIGGTGLWYEQMQKCKHEPQSKKKETGIKTIAPQTSFGKIGVKAGQSAVFLTSLAGITGGVAMGFPLMSVGEGIELGAAPIIQTPVGTGLFGIGIGAFFATLAQEGDHSLQLDSKALKKMSLPQKGVQILQNMGKTLKASFEDGIMLPKQAIALFGKDKLVAQRFFQDTLFSLASRKVALEQYLKADGSFHYAMKNVPTKSYLMSFASLILMLGGASVVASELLLPKQKNLHQKALQLEEAGFLADNAGMTRFGLDKFTQGTGLGVKTRGIGFATGGVVNAVSQFMSLDETYGRGTQWLGVALVFLGFGFDRYGMLQKALKSRTHGSELTKLVQSLHLDLRDVMNPAEIKATLAGFKKGELPDAHVLMGLKHQFEKATMQGKSFDVNQLDARFNKAVTHEQAIVPEQLRKEADKLLNASKDSFVMP
ncbi:MAG: hypothetical protein ACK551_00875 [Vampirovibrionales bacterium]